MLQVWWYHLLKNLEAERERWFLWLPVLFATGIGIYFVLPFEPSIWVTLVLIELTLLVIWFSRRQTVLLWLLAGWSIMLAGFTTVQLKSVYLSQIPQVKHEDKLYLKGRVIAADTNYRGKQRLVLDEMQDYDDVAIPGHYKLTLTSQSAKTKVGDCVEMIAEVRALPQPAAVGAYQLDRKAYFEGLNGSGFVASRVLPIECKQKSNFSLWFSSLIDELRGKVVTKIYQVLPPDEAGVAAAIVAGERGGIAQNITDNYRDSGLAHFLSISGLHMSMIAGMMFFLVRLLMVLIPAWSVRWDSKKVAGIFAILMSVVYLLISGAEIPSQRAFIMTFIVLLGVLFARQAISMRMISWAALIVLVISPQALIGASFQMSFAAVVALIAFYERYAGGLHRFLSGRDNRDTALPVRLVKILWVYFIGIMVSDLVASLATLPFAIYHFNRVSLFTTVTNLWAGPIIGFIIMPFVLLALLLMPVGLDVWPLKLVGLGIDWVNQITAYVAGWPQAAYQVMSMPLWGLLLIVYGALWVCIWQRKWRGWGFVAIVFGLMSTWTVQVPEVMADREGEVFAVQDEAGRIVILPTRGNNYLKKVWLEKTGNEKLSPQKNRFLKAIYNGEKTAPDWIDLVCDERSCLYKGKIRIIKYGGLEIDGKEFDLYSSLGANVYLEDGEVKVKTIRETIGNRFWNE